ncbi:hypothetical protein ASPWEDRAFT_406819 [Aspergillus wentii DTO 134E9]|uniref:stearoyl-CoA 9-desaturase n=1 Tax=Aspergillus wentii DTO 134E9 TaxID=1073089 RepID=A0A1L9RNG0_ASPWE|nr:uncharacterized protein ASPWEDRAFT_406819 [Aspergillus wentii DTO 134E9]OJJ36442.1 hypothetical protein ASPWEDRAFT_406819 [Aspergillus wentii DTO 134E9]
MWSHRAYYASPALRVLLASLGAASFQRSILWWVYLHRAHHRYIDTDRDPYNAKRGLLYSHFGWLFYRKEMDTNNGIDIADLHNDPVVTWQHRHFNFIGFLVGVLLPFLIVGLGWNDWPGAIVYAVIFRIYYILNATFTVNSLAHWAGDQPYSDAYTARNHFITAILTLGEGWHNFHHEFPSDYRNGVRWYDYDPTKWLIWISEQTGFALGLKRFKDENIELSRVQQQQKVLNRREAGLDIGPPLHTLPVVEWEDYEQQVKEGRRLISIAGVVHDVADFIAEHPGGEAYIKSGIGKDATAMFHGGVYHHHNAANNLLAGMRVAVIRGGGEVEAWKTHRR